MKKKISIISFLAIYTFLSILGSGCGSKDPGQRVLVIVSSDTLKQADVDREYSRYMAERWRPADSMPKKELSDTMSKESRDTLSQIQADSIRNQLVQNWIDRKLILRQARADRFVFDLSKAASILGVTDSMGLAGNEMLSVALYLHQIIKENVVTRWEVGQYIKKAKEETESKISFETARLQLEQQKLVEWVNGLRKRGGYRILDNSICAMPLLLVLEDTDTTGRMVGSILKSLYPAGDERLVELVAQTSRIEACGGEVDTAVLHEITELFKKREKAKGANLVKKESRAHLYRSPESIQKRIKKYLPAIQDEYKKELRRNPLLLGRVVVRIVIAEDGSVTGAEVTATAITDTKYLEKLMASIYAWKFPKIPKNVGEMVVNYPFDFAAKE